MQVVKIILQIVGLAVVLLLTTIVTLSIPVAQ